MKLSALVTDDLRQALRNGFAHLRLTGRSTESFLSGLKGPDVHGTLKRFLAHPPSHFDATVVDAGNRLIAELEKVSDSDQHGRAAQELRSALLAYIADAGPMGFSSRGAAAPLDASVAPFVFAYDDNGALAPFVTFSDGESDITDAHPELFGARRKQLYRGWWRRNPYCFLSGREPNPKGHDIPVAVSIMLPLTQEGFEKFLSGEAQTVNIGKEPDLSDLTQYILPPRQSAKHILLDTWIVKPAGRKDRNPGRHRTRFYPTSILNYHLAQLTPEGMAGVKVLIEPDYDAIELLLSNMNAEKAGNAYIIDFSRENFASTRLIRSMESDIADWRKRIFAPA